MPRPVAWTKTLISPFGRGKVSLISATIPTSSRPSAFGLSSKISSWFTKNNSSLFSFAFSTAFFDIDLDESKLSIVVGMTQYPLRGIRGRFTSLIL